MALRILGARIERIGLPDAQIRVKSKLKTESFSRTAYAPDYTSAVNGLMDWVQQRAELQPLVTPIIIVVLFMCILIGPRPVAKAANELQGLTAGNTAFALDLYARLKSTEGNLFFSPYSNSTCLAMTCAGARGDTAAQMARTLHFDPNPAQLAAAFGELQDQLNHARDKATVELAVANGLWAQENQPFLPAFLGIAQQNYEANLNQVDFRASADAARVQINDWVDYKTKGKITDLIQRGVLDPATRLVLVNAI